MAANPQIPQGTINRLRSSITVPNFPSLNVTAAFVGKRGISITFGGAASLRLNTMTGAVISNEPYQECTVTAYLIKSQALSQAWETQRQTNAAIGDISVITDAAPLQAYDLINCSILNVNELSFAGDSEAFPLLLGGYYQINNDMWNLV